MNALIGAAKSKTIWAGTALMVLSNLAPVLPEYLGDIGLNPHTVRIVGSTCAVLMLILRTVTTNSLSDKGTT